MTKEQENYLKAIEDIKQAEESFGKLTSQQKKDLIYSLYGMEAAKEIYRMIQLLNK